MLAITTFGAGAAETIAVDPNAPAPVKEPLRDRLLKTLPTAQVPAPPAPVTQPAIPPALMPSPTPAPPWYKNWKVMVPLGLGAVAAVGVGVWLFKSP